jgi:hypothetical protein
MSVSGPVKVGTRKEKEAWQKERYSSSEGREDWEERSPSTIWRVATKWW